ncbi:MAG: TauD/TfdA family dioxygenase [Kutzneria sp.]|nr:TauD/TfdA family dioxygenase [Kutzneria sp.]
MLPFGVVITSTRPDAAITEVPIPWLRTLARECHLIVLRGFATVGATDEFDAYTRAWGTQVVWDFGTVLELREKASDDPVFDTGFLPIHWDGMYGAYIPEFQMFQCVSAPPAGEGGRTLFCDTSLVLADADAETRKVWDSVTIRYQASRIAHYGGVLREPLVGSHPVTGIPILRFSEPTPEDRQVANRPVITMEDVAPDRAAVIFEDMRSRVYDPRHLYAHQWAVDDILIADNFTLLHTREPYLSGTPRHLRRVQIQGEPPLANCRLTAA